MEPTNNVDLFLSRGKIDKIDFLSSYYLEQDIKKCYSIKNFTALNVFCNSYVLYKQIDMKDYYKGCFLRYFSYPEELRFIPFNNLIKIKRNLYCCRDFPFDYESFTIKKNPLDLEYNKTIKTKKPENDNTTELYIVDFFVVENSILEKTKKFKKMTLSSFNKTALIFLSEKG